MKTLALGPQYEASQDHYVEPGGTIFLVDCCLSRPITRCGERHVFQFGALGGATVEEMHRGGPRVAEYLKRHGSARTKWPAPVTDAMAPEAEWGFEQTLGEDVRRYARRRGLKIRRLRFEQPEAMSPLVADLYRWWNQRRGIPDQRLLVESFILMEPYWTLGTGSVPFWMVFNTEGSLQAIERFLDQRTFDEFDEIYMILFPMGSNRSDSLLSRNGAASLNVQRGMAPSSGLILKPFPRDFAVFVRYHEALLNKSAPAIPVRPH